MSKHYDERRGPDGPDGHDEHVNEHLEDLFEAHGYRKRRAWVLLDDADEDGASKNGARKDDGHRDGTQKEELHMKDAPSTDGPLSPEEEKKRKQRESKSAQREADKKAGWVQCNIKIWDSPDARKSMSTIGLRTEAAEFRAAIWIALEDPHIVSLGARVCRLTGIRRIMMRLMLGHLKAPKTHGA